MAEYQWEYDTPSGENDEGIEIGNPEDLTTLYNVVLEGAVIKYASVTITSDYTAILTAPVILCNNDGDITVTLPLATEFGQFFIKKTNSAAGKVIIAAASGELVDDESQLWITGYQDAVHLISDGTYWNIV